MAENRIVTAFAEHGDGPGWHNTPVWFITRGRDGQLHQSALQPDEQTAEIQTLYRISEEVHKAMVAAVFAALKGEE